MASQEDVSYLCMGTHKITVDCVLLTALSAFQAEDGERTKLWYRQLQYHAQGMGAWRRRRNALANIMINGMQTRN
jgi:hypothetical protein